MGKRYFQCMSPFYKRIRSRKASKQFSSIAQNKIIVYGFSLLELMFAVMIIGVLSAIAIPVYNAERDKTAVNTAISDIVLIQSALEKYYTIHFNYPSSLDDIANNLPNNGHDPWGNPYEYLNIVNGDKGVMGKVRKDHKLNPINSLYDLYSKGKDGVSKTQISQKDSVDDIILARDGGFIGLASDF